jgi:hypothetical protein
MDFEDFQRGFPKPSTCDQDKKIEIKCLKDFPSYEANCNNNYYNNALLKEYFYIYNLAYYIFEANVNLNVNNVVTNIDAIKEYSSYLFEEQDYIKNGKKLPGYTYQFDVTTSQTHIERNNEILLNMAPLLRAVGKIRGKSPNIIQPDLPGIKVLLQKVYKSLVMYLQQLYDEIINELKVICNGSNISVDELHKSTIGKILPITKETWKQIDGTYEIDNPTMIELRKNFKENNLDKLNQTFFQNVIQNRKSYIGSNEGWSSYLSSVSSLTSNLLAKGRDFLNSYWRQQNTPVEVSEEYELPSDVFEQIESGKYNTPPPSNFGDSDPETEKEPLPSVLNEPYTPPDSDDEFYDAEDNDEVPQVNNPAPSSSNKPPVVRSVSKRSFNVVNKPSARNVGIAPPTSIIIKGKVENTEVFILEQKIESLKAAIARNKNLKKSAMVTKYEEELRTLEDKLTKLTNKPKGGSTRRRRSKTKRRQSKSKSKKQTRRRRGRRQTKKKY